MLGTLLSSVVYTFRLKILSLVLIKNCNLCVCFILILSNKLDLNQETHFTIYLVSTLRKYFICLVKIVLFSVSLDLKTTEMSVVKEVSTELSQFFGKTSIQGMSNVADSRCQCHITFFIVLHDGAK